MSSPIQKPSNQAAGATSVNGGGVKPSPSDAKKKEDAKKAADAAKKQGNVNRGEIRNYQADNYGVSPIKKLNRYLRGDEILPAPIKIIPLSGRYAGIAWEVGGGLGLAVEEISQSYGAEWQPIKAGTFAPGVNFSQLTEEKFKLTLSFFDPNFDVTHLTEGIKHLREISGQDRSPPILRYRQGDIKCNVVLTDVEVTFSEPIPGSTKGFRQAGSVSLSFLQVAGPGTGSAQLGAPLTSTIQGDETSRLTEKQRLRRTRKALVDEAVGECLGSRGKSQLNRLIDIDKLEDTSELNKLDPNIFATLAIAGKISPNQLKSEPLASKLKRDLAIFLARGEDGVIRDRSQSDGVADGIVSNGLKVDRDLAEYFMSSDGDAPSRLAALSKGMQPQAVKGRNAFQILYNSVQEGNVATSSLVNDPTGDVFGRLDRPGFKCAFSLSNVDISSLSGTNETTDPRTIAKLKQFIDLNRQPDGKLSDENIKAYQQAFGLDNRNQVEQFRKMMPVNSKKEFVDAVNTIFKNNPKKSGLVIFSKFSSYNPSASGGSP